MTMIGADTAQLSDLASEFGDTADELDELARTLARSIDRTTAWQGPSADRCKEQFGELAQTQMRQVADELAAARRHLQVNAWAQDIASSDTNLLTVIGRLWDAGVVGYGIYQIKKVWDRVSQLGRFFDALRMPATGFAALSRVEKWIGLGREFLRGVSTNPLMRAVARISPYLTLVTAFNDIRTGGGYEGARRWATQGFALAGFAGAAATVAMSVGLIAAAPVTVAVAAVGLTLYAGWSLVNYAIDNREAIDRAVGVATGWVGDRWDAATRAAGLRATTMLAQPIGATR